jgi:hypothetical protein
MRLSTEYRRRAFATKAAIRKILMNQLKAKQAHGYYRWTTLEGGEVEPGGYFIMLFT